MNRLLLLCLVLLAGCGGAASQSAGTPVPTADVTGISAGGFKAVVKGAVTGEYTGTGSYFKQEEGGLLISLVAADDPRGTTITLILPAGTLPGIYPAKSYAEAYDSGTNQITGVGASFSLLANNTGVDAYAFVSEGELMLQSLDPVTGSVHFKAKMESGGEVEVDATFYQLTAV